MSIPRRCYVKSTDPTVVAALAEVRINVNQAYRMVVGPKPAYSEL